MDAGRPKQQMSALASCSGVVQPKPPRGWFPATQSCSLMRESSPERDLEAQETEALGRLVFWALTAPPNERQLLEGGSTPGWAPTGVAQAG